MRVERRKWERLPLAIPVFLRNHPGESGGSVEFASARDVSGGGMLVVSRRSRSVSSRILLEIPVAPLDGMAEVPAAARCFDGIILRSQAADGYHLLAVQFSSPLGESPSPVKKRKPMGRSPRRPTTSRVN